MAFPIPIATIDPDKIPKQIKTPTKVPTYSLESGVALEGALIASNVEVYPLDSPNNTKFKILNQSASRPNKAYGSS